MFVFKNYREFLIVIVSTHRASSTRLSMWKLKQAAVHLLAKGASNENGFQFTQRTFKQISDTECIVTGAHRP